jgi:hypothetical protein
MLRKAPGDQTGALVLKDIAQVSLDVGESVLVQVGSPAKPLQGKRRSPFMSGQGSHIFHQANQSQLGCRITWVVSLIPESPLFKDMTRCALGHLCRL